MREILFRGKREDGEGWVYGHYHNTTYVGYPKGGDIITRHYILPPNAGDAHVVIPETVGQYTGLNDKNGTKIFEGDVVRVERDLWSGENKKEREIFNGVVWYDEKTTGFGLKSKKYRCLPLHRFAGDNQTVIGNIHDNPELLEVE